MFPKGRYTSGHGSLTSRTGGLFGWRRLIWRSVNNLARRRRRGRFRSYSLSFKARDIAIFETLEDRWGSLSVKPVADSPGMRPTKSSNGYETSIPIRGRQSRSSDGGTPPKSNSWPECQRSSWPSTFVVAAGWLLSP